MIHPAHNAYKKRKSATGYAFDALCYISQSSPSLAVLQEQHINLNPSLQEKAFPSVFAIFLKISWGLGRGPIPFLSTGGAI